MADIFKMFAVEEDLAENGVWFNFRDGIRFKVRSSKSKTYKQLSDSVMKRARKIARKGAELPEAAATQMMIEIVQKGLLVDWEGVKAGGEVLAFTPKNIRDVLQIEEVRLFIGQIADEHECFQSEGEDEGDDEKNS